MLHSNCIQTKFATLFTNIKDMNIIIDENVFPNQHFKLVKQNIGLLQTENYPKKKSTSSSRP